MHDEKACVSKHHQRMHLNRASAFPYSLLVEIQSSSCVLIGIVCVDLHEMAKYMVGEKAQRQHAAVFRKAVKLPGALAG
jgi:hypothetical protein